MLDADGPDQVLLLQLEVVCLAEDAHVRAVPGDAVPVSAAAGGVHQEGGHQGVGRGRGHPQHGVAGREDAAAEDDGARREIRKGTLLQHDGRHTAKVTSLHFSSVQFSSVHPTELPTKTKKSLVKSSLLLPIK